MEWVIFVTAILVAVNVIALIHFNINQAELDRKVDNVLFDVRTVMTQNQLIYQRTCQNAEKLEHILDVELVDLAGHITDAHTKIQQVHNEFSHKTAEELEDISVDADELTQNELARLARKEAFDKRIAELREELGYESYGTHAEESHPDVKNLPHNIIPTSLYDLPSVEIAD